MIPVGTSVNPGELRSGSKWEKTFISCLGVADTSLGTHIVYTLNKITWKTLKQLMEIEFTIDPIVIIVLYVITVYLIFRFICIKRILKNICN